MIHGQTICFVLLKKLATSIWSNSSCTNYWNKKYPQVYLLNNTVLNLTRSHKITLSTPITWRKCSYINIDLPSIYLKGGFKNFLIWPYTWILIWHMKSYFGLWPAKLQYRICWHHVIIIYLPILACSLWVMGKLSILYY